MSSTNTPNMSLPLPTVGNQPGPDYALNINQCLTLLDQHDHSPGSGVQITPAGLNINSNLSLQDNALTLVKSILFQSQTAVTALQSLYVAPGTETPVTQDLWFTDSNGVAIQITSGGAVNATIASIPGESYSAGTFYWKQGALSTTPANFDIGSITIRPSLAATVLGVQLVTPAAIASQYSLTLPLLPSSQSVMTLDNSGNILTPTVFPLPAAGLASDSVTTVKILDQNVTTAKIADLNITTAKIANGAVTAAKLAAGAVEMTAQTFNSSGSFTVPTGVNQVLVYGVGGGGGGGAGCGSAGAISRGGGGGGGGALSYLLPVAVTPGDVISVVIAAGGAGGTGTVTNGNGGSTGGNSSFGSITFYGAPGGSGGGPNGGGGGGATGGLSAEGIIHIAGGGGASTAVTGASGGRSVNFAGAVGGGGSGGISAGGGGGGGSSSNAAGGVGGNAGNSGGSLAAGAVGSLGSGGGGGGASGNSVGAAGGQGGGGSITVYWVD